MSQFIIQNAVEQHKKFTPEICKHYEESAKARGTGIAKRSEEYIDKKIEEGKAIIATTRDGRFAGFCYIETWGQGKNIANSGLIVIPEFRNQGLAKEIKMKAFQLSRKKYPASKLFGLTTSLAVMKINSDLGYVPVTFEELTDDMEFWKGCQSCVNYEILKSKGFKNCFCTGMVYDPKARREKKWQFVKKARVYERLIHMKRVLFSRDKSSKRSFVLFRFLGI